MSTPPAAEAGGRLVRRAVALDRSKLAVATGLRNAAGIVAPLAVGVATGHVADGLAASSGALVAGFADLGGSYRGRAQTMLLATVGAAVSTFVGAVTGAQDVAAVALMAVWGFAAGLAVALGPAAAFVALLAALSLLLSADFPASPDAALGRAALVLAGGVLQTALAVAVWPLRRHQPERDAVAAVYRAMAGSIDRTEYIPAIAAAEAMLAETLGRGDGHTVVAEGLRTALDEADRLIVERIALQRGREALLAGDAETDVTAIDAVQAAAVEAFARIAETLETRTAQRDVADIRARVASAQGELEAQRAAADGPARALLGEILARSQALRGQVRAAMRAARAAVRLDDEDRSQAQGATTSGDAGRRSARDRRAHDRRARDPLATLRANLTLDSTAFRHAIRLGTALAVAVAVYRVFPLQRGYWVPLTVIFVLRPDFASTFTRGLQRYAGTALGAGLATLLTVVFAPGDVTLMLLCFVFAAGTYAFFYANYALFTGSITALVVFLVAFGGDSEYATVVDRLIDTAIGGAIALVAFAVWPTWEGPQATDRLATLLEMARAYVGSVLRALADPDRYDASALATQRRAARLARTNAEASVAASLAEPATRRIDGDTAAGILAGLRRLDGGALVLEAHLEDRRARRSRPAAAALAADSDAALGAMAEAVRADRPPPPPPPLREDQAALAAEEGEADLVSQETDRMVDGIDTLNHLLRAGRGDGDGGDV